ncbi:nucleotidyltransferase family protein [Aliikangiella sp. IMCC44653]
MKILTLTPHDKTTESQASSNPALQSLNLAGVVIAAGNSSRLGEAKQLIKLFDNNLLTHSIKLLNQVSHNSFCVVGYESEKMCSEVPAGLAEFIVNSNWQLGMGTSIACAVNRIKHHFNGVLICLCDQWKLTAQDLKTLTQTWHKNPHKIIASRYFDKVRQEWVSGAPCIFPRSYFKELLNLKNTGAKYLLEQEKHNVINLDLAHAAFDIDTPQDLAALLKTYPKSQRDS